MTGSSRIKSPEEIQRVLSRPGISPHDLYALGVIPVSRNSIYEACRRFLDGAGESPAAGVIECFRVGKKIIIPTAPLRRKLGLEVQ